MDIDDQNAKTDVKYDLTMQYVPFLHILNKLAKAKT